MIKKNHRFSDFLSGNSDISTPNVLFEPFISKEHAESLIWRRGAHLWDTPSSYIDTLVSLSERTESGTVFANMQLFDNAGKKELLQSISESPMKYREIEFCAICSTQYDISLCEKNENISFLAVYGKATSKKLPVVRMDGDIIDSILRGDEGWFAACDAEYYLAEYGSRIKIMGGLGADRIARSSPVEIYTRIEKLAGEYKGKWACGSGGEIPNGCYLELISLLGAYARIK